MRGHAVALAAALLALAAFPAGAAEDVGRIEAGRKIATGFCSKCHAVGPSMISPNEAAPPFRALAEDPALTEQAIRQLLMTSHETMPDYVLSAEERDVLSAYIRSLARR